MVDSEGKRIEECVEAGRYEEALSLDLDASRAEINRSHMKLLARFWERPSIRALINQAKSRITCETDLEKGRRLTRIGRKEDAVKYLVAALERSGDADDYLLTGQTLEQTWKSESAVTYFEKAVELRGEPSDYLWLGTSLLGINSFESAEQAFKKAIELRGSADDHRLLGSLYLKIGDLMKAEIHLKRSVALGDNLSAVQLLGECTARLSRQKIEKFLAAFRTLQEVTKTRPYIWIFAGAIVLFAVVFAVLNS